MNNIVCINQKHPSNLRRMHKILKSVKSVAIKNAIRNKPSQAINRKKLV